MKNIHKIHSEISDEIKLLIARWHIDNPNKLDRRFGYTKWENNNLYYKREYSKPWQRVDALGIVGNYSPLTNGTDFDFNYCYKTRTSITLYCFQEDMLRMG